MSEDEAAPNVKRSPVDANHSEEPPLKVKRLTDNATLPFRATCGSAGYDLCSAENTTIPAGTRKMVRTDLSIAVPANHYGRIAPRSGLAFKKGIDIGAGVIDPDYTGPIGLVLCNNGTSEFMIKQGDRVAQLLIERVAVPEIMEVQELDKTTRGAGGFGSTGNVTP
tara:strand:- start:5982 stop:6479 length:498 start_codon:yes stop_codon:yes gene_type:complete